MLGISVDEMMQIKEAKDAPEKKNVNEIVDMVLKAVGLAMGMAVVVLSILGELESQSGMMLLGIGMVCLAITMMNMKK